MQPVEAEISDRSTVKRVESKIRNAWIAAIITGCVTLAFTIIAVNGRSVVAGTNYDIWTLVDVVFIFLMAFGIYWRSRTAAVLMFGYFLASKLVFWLSPGGFQLSSFMTGLLFLYLYFEGVRGTFSYHRSKPLALVPS